MDEIIDYAINTPENTNPNVLKSMLNQLPTLSTEDRAILASAISDNGMGYIDRAYKPLFVLEEQTVEFAAPDDVTTYVVGYVDTEFALGASKNYIVSIDGAEYTATGEDILIDSDDTMNFEDELPFRMQDGGMFLPPSYAGTHTISIALGAQTVTADEATTTESGADIYLAYFGLIPEMTFVSGNKYRVVWDEVVYTTIANSTTGIIGDLYDNEDPMAPFAMYIRTTRVIPGGIETYIVVAASTPGVHSFYIEELVETVHTIDSKFLGYDAVIELNDAWELSVKSGSFADCYAKGADGNPLNIGVWYSEMGVFGRILYLQIAEINDVPTITIKVATNFSVDGSTGAVTIDTDYYATITWTSDGVSFAS